MGWKLSAYHLRGQTRPPGTDETAMDFRRFLPEIRWQPRLSPGFGTGSPDWFFEPVPGLPRNRSHQTPIQHTSAPPDTGTRAAHHGKLSLSPPAFRVQAASAG